MALPKLKNSRGFYKGGVVKILDDVELLFSHEMLEKILLLHNTGYKIEELSEYMKRDPDEIFLALFHLSRQGYEIAPIGKRFK